MDKKSLRQIYFGLVHQKLQYCVSCWGGCFKSEIGKLEVLQRKAIRNIEQADYRSPTSSFFQKHKILKVRDIYFFQISKIMFKIYNNSWLGNFKFCLINQIHSYETRSSLNLNFYIQNKKISNSSIMKIGPKIWNSLPKCTKLLNFNLFKRTIKNQKLAAY